MVWEVQSLVMYMFESISVYISFRTYTGVLIESPTYSYKISTTLRAGQTVVIAKIHIQVC